MVSIDTTNIKYDHFKVNFKVKVEVRIPVFSKVLIEEAINRISDNLSICGGAFNYRDDGFEMSCEDVKSKIIEDYIE